MKELYAERNTLFFLKYKAYWEKVRTVRLLGVGNLAFTQYAGLLVIELPDRMPTKYANALEITF